MAMSSEEIIELVNNKMKFLETIENSGLDITLNPEDAIDGTVHNKQKSEEENRLDRIIREIILIKTAEENSFTFLGVKDTNKQNFSIKDKLLFQCEAGHIKEDTYKKFSNRSTKLCCEECKISGKQAEGKLKIILKSGDRIGNYERTKSYAESQNYTILSTKYENNEGKLDFLCPDGHNVSDSVLNINRREGEGMCCDECNNIAEIKEIKELIEIKGGILLSERYKNQDTVMNFICAEGHPVEKTKKQIQHGVWCDCCADNKLKSEKKIKMFVEVFFMENFNKTRDQWNTNPTARKPVTVELINKFLKSKKDKQTFQYKQQPMELDIYNKNLKIAFEYNGEFHYKLNPRIKNNTAKQVERLIKYQSNDSAKQRNCEKMGVNLITIPFLKDYDTKVFEKSLTHFIKHCKSQGLEVSYTNSQLEYMKEVFHNISKVDSHIKSYKEFLKAKKVKKNSMSI